ncbi:MAG: DUF2304 domain-containing protein [Lachnospiraceae bacterium]|nr:DUF2304 domain-containing protein [Lachnospiraceae bacterium]
MSITLRIVLLFAGIITAIWILRKIYKCKVKLGDAIYWICMAILLVVFGIIPESAYFFTKMLGIQAPVNFIFLFMLAVVIEKLFTLSIKVSQLEDKITVLSAEVALRSNNSEKQITELKEKR